MVPETLADGSVDREERGKDRVEEMRKNKYTEGPKICSIEALVSYIKAGEWIYLCGRPKHPSFFEHMQLKTLMGFIDKGMFYVAMEVKDGRNN